MRLVKSQRSGERDIIDLRYLGAVTTTATAVTSTITAVTISQLNQAIEQDKSAVVALAQGFAIGPVSYSTSGAASTLARTWSIHAGNYVVNLVYNGMSKAWTIQIQS